MTGLHDLTDSNHQFDAYTGYNDGTQGSHGFEIPDHAYTGCFDGISQIRNTFHKLIHLRGILTGLRYLKGSNQQFDAFTGYFDGTSRPHIFQPLFTC